MFKRLLVPLDGSRFGSRALGYAIEVARRFGAEIILLQVVKPAMPVVAATGGTSAVAAQVALDTDKKNVVRAMRYLSGKAREVKSQGIKGSYHVIVGDPAQSIMKLSQKEHIDLVVMTTHGKSGLKRVIMGSTADTVIRESKKPVLVIRPQTRSKK